MTESEKDSELALTFLKQASCKFGAEHNFCWKDCSNCGFNVFEEIKKVSQEDRDFHEPIAQKVFEESDLYTVLHEISDDVQGNIPLKDYSSFDSLEETGESNFYKIEKGFSRIQVLNMMKVPLNFYLSQGDGILARQISPFSGEFLDINSERDFECIYGSSQFKYFVKTLTKASTWRLVVFKVEKFNKYHLGLE